jgi:hypothetical protein
MWQQGKQHGVGAFGDGCGPAIWGADDSSFEGTAASEEGKTCVQKRPLRVGIGCREAVLGGKRSLGHSPAIAGQRSRPRDGCVERPTLPGKEPVRSPA